MLVPAMPYAPRTYRLAPALLAVALLLSGVGPLLAHLCPAGAQHAAMAEHAAMTEPAAMAPMDAREAGSAPAARGCCGAHCPERSGAPADGVPGEEPPAHPSPSDEAPTHGECCVIAPAAPAERIAVAAPTAPQGERALFAAVTTIRAAVEEAPPVLPAPADTEGPPWPVRSHLALSILLI